MELYRGDFLDGIGVHDAAFEEWLRSERERLCDLARDALTSLLDHQTTTRATHRAIATARQLLALDPLQEAVHRALMRLYVAKGEHTLALKQYQACCDVLRAELDLKPEAETERLHEEIRREDPAVRGERDAAVEEERPEPPPLPDKPSIAVLPFVNMSGDAEPEYFSDGITEDIITGLSRFRELFVIARNSTFTYKGEAVDVTEVVATTVSVISSCTAKTSSSPRS